MRKFVKWLAILYLPFFLVGALLFGIAIVLVSIALFIMLEFKDARNAYEFMKRSILRRRL